MIQSQKILLWKREEPKDKNFEDFAREAFDTLSVLQVYPSVFRPNYLSAYRKKDVKPF